MHNPFDLLLQSTLLVRDLIAIVHVFLEIRMLQCLLRSYSGIGVYIY